MGRKRLSVRGTEFIVGDRAVFLNGVNTPWDNWNDIGGNFNESFWRTHFAELRECGVNASRVWISCDGNVGFTIDEEGFVTAVSDKYWDDLGTLLQIAEEYGIYLMATIMSFDHFKDSGRPGTKYMSWRAMLNNEDAMDYYVDKFIIPLCRRFGHSDSLFGIDLCNEPDWIYENKDCGRFEWSGICALFAKEAAAIHKNSDILVTIGFSMVKYNSAKYRGNFGSDEYLRNFYGDADARLDFYSPHFYEWEASQFGFLFDMTPAEFGLDGTKPAVIGEFPAKGFTSATKGSRVISGSDCCIALYEKGWNGAFAWTSNNIDICGGLPDFLEGTKEIARRMSMGRSW
jgi:hypothetical protein